MQELQEALQKALTELPDDFRDDLSFELEDLMKFMTQAGIRTKTKLQIFVALVENRCDAGIVREVANIALDQVEGKVHIMESPEMLIKWAYRDAALTPDDPKAVRLLFFILFFSWFCIIISIRFLCVCVKVPIHMSHVLFPCSSVMHCCSAWRR